MLTKRLSPTVMVVTLLVLAVIVGLAVLKRTSKPTIGNAVVTAGRAGAADRLSGDSR